MKPQALINETYGRLLAAYGPQHWWPAESAFEMMVGAVLTQACSWGNVEKAITALRAANALSPRPLVAIPHAELARLIRPTGYYNAKARKLKTLATFVVTHLEGDPANMAAIPTGELRELLLAVHGVGAETADNILLYAAGRPVFVVDAYTRRLAVRLGLAAEGVGYEELSALFAGAFRPGNSGSGDAGADAMEMGEYHALIVAHAKVSCKKSPLCGTCVLRVLCPTGIERAKAINHG
jgi:endonuclease-3 related protein